MKKIVVIILFFCFISNIKAERVSVTLDSCVDGDTIKVLLDNKKTTVRFLAIDTPETVHPTKEVEPYGKESSDYTCDSVKNAKKLELEYDPGSDKTDKYERVLAWVYVDDKLLQSDLVSLGYAKVAYLYGDYLYTDELKEFEKEAGEKKLGIWSEEEYISSDEEKQSEEDKNDGEIEKSLGDQIKDLIKEYIKDALKSLFKDLKKDLKKAWNNIFN